MAPAKLCRSDRIHHTRHVAGTLVFPLRYRHKVNLVYIADGISEVIAGGEDVLGGYYLADQSSSHHLARLHVLVCGFCHSVFHVLEEFKR